MTYIQYSDHPKHYRICKADKYLRNFSDPVDIKGVTAPQHGSFMRITRKEYKKLLTKTLICDYNELSKLEYLLNQENITIKNKEFLNQITLTIELTDEQLEVLKTLLSRNILLS